MSLLTLAGWIVTFVILWRMISQGSRISIARKKHQPERIRSHARQTLLAIIVAIAFIMLTLGLMDSTTSTNILAMVGVLLLGVMFAAFTLTNAIVRAE